MARYLFSPLPQPVSTHKDLDSPVWQVHLDAARTVMGSSHETSSSMLPEDTTTQFLQQELFIANTFASTTNFLGFSHSDTLAFNPQTSKPSVIFIEFLKLLQMVTNLSRQTTTHHSYTTTPISPSGLRTLFEHARAQTLKIASTSSQDYLHLTRTVKCFYHAGLLYSYRLLLLPSHERQTQLSTSKTELLHALSFTETNKPTFAQDLVWPLFIAGTEAASIEEKEMVVAKLRLAMSETGFSNCVHAVEFLDAFWQEKQRCAEEKEVEWIPFAKQWTRMGKTFLVF